MIKPIRLHLNKIPNQTALHLGRRNCRYPPILSIFDNLAEQSKAYIEGNGCTGGMDVIFEHIDLGLIFLVPTHIFLRHTGGVLLSALMLLLFGEERGRIACWLLFL